MNAWFGQLSTPNKLPFKKCLWRFERTFAKSFLFKQADLCLNFNFSFFFFFFFSFYKFPKLFQLDDRPFVLVLYDNVFVPLMPTCRYRRSRPTSATSSPPPSPLPLVVSRSTLRLITLIIVPFGVISLIIRNQPRGSSKISPDWPTVMALSIFFFFFVGKSPFSLIVLTWH